jgi:transcriptional regulator with XRE-family HTH domain
MNALAGDPYLAENAFAGAARAAAALLGSDEREMRSDTRLALEQVRQALRDIMEARPVDEDAEPAQVAAWLEENLGLSQQQLAELVGSSARTWQRWLTGTQPDPEQLVRLRRIARLAMHLRHALTGPGVARWFIRPHPLLKAGTGRPIDLLDDPEGYQKLLVLASGLRSTQAS